MSNKSKGTHHEKKVADYLIAQGYEVARGFKKCGFIGGRVIPITYDLFGAFDIVAIRQAAAGVPAEVRFIQVTSSHAGDGGNVAARKRKCFEVWPASEVWEWVKTGWYCVHRVGGSQSMVDVSALLKPKAANPA